MAAFAWAAREKEELRVSVARLKRERELTRMKIFLHDLGLWNDDEDSALQVEVEELSASLDINTMPLRRKVDSSGSGSGLEDVEDVAADKGGTIAKLPLDAEMETAGEGGSKETRQRRREKFLSAARFLLQFIIEDGMRDDDDADDVEEEEENTGDDDSSDDEDREDGDFNAEKTSLRGGSSANSSNRNNKNNKKTDRSSLLKQVFGAALVVMRCFALKSSVQEGGSRAGGLGAGLGSLSPVGLCSRVGLGLGGIVDYVAAADSSVGGYNGYTDYNGYNGYNDSAEPTITAATTTTANANPIPLSPNASVCYQRLFTQQQQDAHKKRLVAWQRKDSTLRQKWRDTATRQLRKLALLEQQYSDHVGFLNVRMAMLGWRWGADRKSDENENNDDFPDGHEDTRVDNDNSLFNRNLGHRNLGQTEGALNTASEQMARTLVQTLLPPRPALNPTLSPVQTRLPQTPTLVDDMQRDHTNDVVYPSSLLFSEHDVAVASRLAASEITQNAHQVSTHHHQQQQQQSALIAPRLPKPIASYQSNPVPHVSAVDVVLTQAAAFSAQVSAYLTPAVEARILCAVRLIGFEGQLRADCRVARENQDFAEGQRLLNLSKLVHVTLVLYVSNLEAFTSTTAGGALSHLPSSQRQGRIPSSSSPSSSSSSSSCSSSSSFFFCACC